MASMTSRLRQRSAPMVNPSSRTRRPRNKVSYNEDSADSDDLDGYMSQEDYEEPVPPARPRRSRPPLVTPTRTSPRSTQIRKRKVPASNSKMTEIGAKRQKKKSSQWKVENCGFPPNAIHFTGKTMPWLALPYHILASIFAYASHPLIDNIGEPTISAAWLVQMALVCKAFTEPALAALYFEPPVSNPRQIQKLQLLLMKQGNGSTINYAGKIKYLSMGVVKVTNPVESLIPLVPQLRGIALGLCSDDPKVLRQHTVPSSASWESGMSIFSTLSEFRTRLESWTWNRTLSYHFVPLAVLKDVHQSNPFQSLKSLTFVDFHLPEMYEYNGQDIRGEEALADTLIALPSLRKLQFSLADVVNERLMPILPDNLESLVLKSCYNLYSPALAKFLVAKGRQIRELVLSHNQSLNLSFLTELSQACPKLEILQMNLLYYNSHTTYTDSNPRYTSLLGDGEKPSWPVSLRRLELFQLRRWKTAAAELFFSSFIDTPVSLRNLRHLEIKASIDESGWRDRIAFRDKWVRRLNEVFFRKSAPPNTHLQSFAAYKFWKAQQTRPMKAQAVVLPTRSAQRQQTPSLGAPAQVAAKSTAVSTDSDSDAPLMNVRRSTRAKPQKAGIYNESDGSPSKATQSRRRHRRRGPDESSEDDSALEDEDTGLSTWRNRKGSEVATYVQGLCDVVDVVIDNLRPTEEQLNENDFLDEEPSGDEDWNGDDNIDDGYAW